MKGKLVKCLTTATMITMLTTGIGTITCEASSTPKLNKTKVTLTVGKTTTLKVKNLSKKVKVTWKSSKKSVATVSSKGKVKAKKKGTAVIKATFKYKKSGKLVKKTLKCKVTVKAKAVKKVTPTSKPTATPTVAPTATATPKPTATPTVAPTATPTAEPTVTPTAEPTTTPTVAPTATPTVEPTEAPVEVVSPETPVHVHDYNARYEVVKEANCYEEGLINMYCECGDVYTRTIDITHSNHDFSVVNPTETEDGYLDCHCNECGQDFKEILLAVNEENYPLEGWVYKICQPDRNHEYPYIWVKDYKGTSEYPALKDSYVIDGIEYKTITRGEILCSSPTVRRVVLYNTNSEMSNFDKLSGKLVHFSVIGGRYKLNIPFDRSVLPGNIIARCFKSGSIAKLEWDGLNYRWIPLNDEAKALCEKYGYEWDKLWWEEN